MDEGSSEQAPFLTTPAVLAVAVGTLLRWYQLPGQIIADDEWHAIHTLLGSGYRGILTSFGLADHSIPLTLFYKAAADSIGLSEMTMRLPSLVAGIALLVLFPRLVRPLIGRFASDVFAWLLAVSPLLILYSRTARPYSLTAFCALPAICLAWRWWRRPRPAYLVGYVALTGASAYLHLASLPLVASPIPIFLVTALFEARGRRIKSLGRVFVLAAWTAGVLALLLAPPIYSDVSSLTMKSGLDAIGARAAATAVGLFAGTSNVSLEVTAAVLALAGAMVLLRRHPLLTSYGFACIAISLAATAASGAKWLSHGAVLARYLLGVLPIFLMVASCGIEVLTAPLAIGRLSLRGFLAGGFVCLLFALGPLPATYYRPNDFTNHAMFQFSFDPETNPYVSDLRPKRISEFYTWLGHQPPDSLSVVEAPWRYEWHFNRLPFFQQVHRQRVLIGFVNGLCAGARFGEIPAGRPGFAFKNFVQLSNEESLANSHAAYVILHREHWDAKDDEIDFSRCVEELRRRLGDPIFSDDDVRVFAVVPPTHVPSD